MCTKRDGFDKGHGMLPFMGWPLAITRIGPPAMGHSIKGRIPKSCSFIPSWFHATATASLACAQKVWKRTFCGCTSFSSWRRSILAGRMMDQGQVIQHAQTTDLRPWKTRSFSKWWSMAKYPLQDKAHLLQTPHARAKPLKVSARFSISSAHKVLLLRPSWPLL